MLASPPSNLDLILDVELELSADIGGCAMPVAQVLALGPGSVVEFTHPVDAPIDLKVNGRTVARGEIVAIDGRFGLRLTELVALGMIGASSGAALPLDILTGLTLVAVLPFLLVMTTSFVRIVVVLSLVRSAIGTQALPPNTVITGLALVLTLVVMSPTLERISSDALAPYEHHQISNTEMIARGIAPLRAFMLRQTARQDADFFEHVAHRPAEPFERAPLTVVVPAFVVGELRRGFSIGLSMYLPFIAIDLVVSATLMGLGMFMLSPSVVSLPCKLYLFVMVDGWSAICGSIATSFR